MPKNIAVRVLHTPGCPNLISTIDPIERIGNELSIPVAIDEILGSSVDQAVELRCLGSPTVQINGIDLEPAAPGRMNFGLGLRSYGASGVPSEEMVRNGLSGNFSCC